jgi:hypothetical protein
MDIEEEAARAEIARLADAGPGLAAEIMRAWQSDPNKGLTQPEISAWLLRDFPAGPRLLQLLRSAVRRACELLVKEGLLEERRPVGYVVGSDGAAGSGADLFALSSRGKKLTVDRDLDRWAAHYVRRHLARMTDEGTQGENGGPEMSWTTPGYPDPTMGFLRDAFDTRRSGRTDSPS